MTKGFSMVGIIYKSNTMTKSSYSSTNNHTKAPASNTGTNVAETEPTRQLDIDDAIGMCEV
jgi:hypothetical protein